MQNVADISFFERIGSGIQQNSLSVFNRGVSNFWSLEWNDHQKNYINEQNGSRTDWEDSVSNIVAALNLYHDFYDNLCHWGNETVERMSDKDKDKVTNILKEIGKMDKAWEDFENSISKSLNKFYNNAKYDKLYNQARSIVSKYDVVG